MGRVERARARVALKVSLKRRTIVGKLPEKTEFGLRN